jgi:hypothetical protein
LLLIVGGTTFRYSRDIDRGSRDPDKAARITVSDPFKVRKLDTGTLCSQHGILGVAASCRIRGIPVGSTTPRQPGSLSNRGSGSL